MTREGLFPFGIYKFNILDFKLPEFPGRIVEEVEFYSSDFGSLRLGSEDGIEVPW